MPKFIDLTNQRFGKLLVLGIDEKNKYNKSNRLQWKCLCDCGEICYKTTESLKRTSTTPKACTKKCGASLQIGLKKNFLTIIEPIYNSNQATKYRCLCDCGNETIVTKSDFLSGSTKSCGCYQKAHMANIAKNQSRDITNIKFGKLTPQRPTSQRQGKSIIWECLCDCGNIHYASLSNLTNGSVSRCSKCYSSSKGEDKIRELLQLNKLKFVQQKTFDSCRFPNTKALARFDFFVNDEYLIEFDGIQHFQYSNYGWDTKEHFEKTQQRDNYKNQWSKENNIPLIRIPYNYFDQLSIEDLIPKTSKFVIN